MIVSNHISLFDTLVIPYVLLAAQGLHIVRPPAKEELFRNFLLRCLLTSWGAFPIRRSQGDLRAMRQMCTYMCTEQMMLFPEGTRSVDGWLGRGNRVVGKLIYLARPIVIPTAILGTDRLLAKGRLLPRLFSTLEVRFGPPLDLESYYAAKDTKATAEALMTAVMRSIARLRGEEAMWLKRFPA